MATQNIPKCNRCGRPEREGTGWEQRSKYKDGSGIFFIHTDCPEKVCKERVRIDRDSRWPQYKVCSRDVKEQWTDGKWYCGIHLAAKKRVAKNRHAFDIESEANKSNRARANMAIDILKELGIAGSSDYDGVFQHRYTGKIIIDPADLFEYLGIGVKLPPIRKKGEE